MLVESFVLEPTPDYPLFIVAKRYWVPEFNKHAENPAAQTLIVLHSTSFHKETWEPTLTDLFEMASQPRPKATIREAWAIDCPNHGEAGERNRKTLKGPGFEHFSCEKYAQAVHRFLSAGLIGGAGVDFRKRNLVGIGHSLGANAMLLLQSIQPTFKFSSLVIVDPMVSVEGPQHLLELREKLVKRARKRTKCWPTLDEAVQDYNDPRRHGAKWDPRVRDLFVRHGLYWSEKIANYRICCTREQEVAMYMDEEGPIKPVETLDRICHSVPVHLILGAIPDLIPAHVHEALINPKSGRRFASIVKLNVGHLVPQEAPTQLASHILMALSANPPDYPTCRL
ncbi:hypothetical protein BDN70DRAFT_884596 [Pholiota conissans]|uniref:AB hydrolase-1 domain-containing protein n=1 Tax=Pholiota conissans TaxID=109636 RepID=A0A9P6CQ25_9AGAR|nr:hypothetical protein BDN70DRAFT_884596 [Pholiota conissans]